MFKILGKELLAPNIYQMEIEAPRVAHAAKPGQFIILRLDEEGERVPLTIADYDTDRGSVTIVIQTVGYSTSKLCEMNPGESIADLRDLLASPQNLCTNPSSSCAKNGFCLLLVAWGPLRSIRRSNG